MAKLLIALIRKMPLSVGFLALALNVLSRLMGKRMVVTFSRDGKHFGVVDKAGGRKVLLGSSARVYSHLAGVKTEQDRLASLYLGDIVKVPEGETVLDVGANVGVFSLALEERGCQVIAVEADPREFEALNKNLAGRGQAVEACLWSSSEHRILWRANDSGDTSLLPGASSVPMQVKTITLDELWTRHEWPWPYLVKIEAEGAEPEVIEGGSRTIAAASYVTVDCSPERQGDSPFVLVRERLEKLGFVHQATQIDGSRTVEIFSKNGDAGRPDRILA